MKPSRFDYAAPATLSEALTLMQSHQGEARVLAGGQSLMPLMNLRMARPSCLVDLNGVHALDYIREENGVLHIGAMTRQRTVERSELVQRRLPLLVQALSFVGHFQIRNRGTIVGSICHADPASELPAIWLTVGGRLAARSADSVREVDAGGFIRSPFDTVLRETEIATDLSFDLPPEHAGWSVQEVARRRGDFALAGVAASLTCEHGIVSQPRLTVFGAVSRPMRLSETEELINGADAGAEVAAAAGASATKEVKLRGDVHASTDSRQRMLRALVRRAVIEASERAAHE